MARSDGRYRGWRTPRQQPPERRLTCPCYRRLVEPEDFSRVHNVVGVNRFLDRTHNTHSVAVLGNQKVYLAATDTVLAGAGAAER